MSPIQFVSLGPGEAELITLKGLKALQNADCIFCPETPVRDSHSLSRAADIMLRLDIPANRIRRFSLPMSKQRTDALNAYDQVYAPKEPVFRGPFPVSRRQESGYRGRGRCRLLLLCTLYI